MTTLAGQIGPGGVQTNSGERQCRCPVVRLQDGPLSLPEAGTPADVRPQLVPVRKRAEQQLQLPDLAIVEVVAPAEFLNADPLRGSRATGIGRLLDKVHAKAFSVFRTHSCLVFRG